MLFSTNSAIAFKGLLCESAIIRIAFQSSPMRSLPLSLLFVFMVGSEESGARNAATVKHEDCFKRRERAFMDKESHCGRRKARQWRRYSRSRSRCGLTNRRSCKPMSISGRFAGLLQATEQSGMTRVRVVLSDRDPKRLGFSGQHDQFLSTRDPGINKIPF